MNCRVLVVDDDNAICELVKEVLTGAGLEVLALTDSETAARHVAREKFDAIFLDVRMPAPDGFELARRARASGFNQKTPIVMIAGDSDPGLQNRGFEAGANFFLYKPFDRQRLLRILSVTQGTIQQERRRFQRVQVRAKLKLEHKGTVLNGTTLDMSLNGVLAQSSTAFPAGSVVQIEIHLRPGAAPLKATGRVARVIGTDCMGIQIERMAQNDCEAMQDFLLPLILSITQPKQEASPAATR